MNPNKTMMIEVGTFNKLREALDNLRIFAEGIRNDWEEHNPGKEYNPFRVKLIVEAQDILTRTKEG